VTYTVGQVFTIAGVYACHPETKASLGYLQQFTNTAGTGSGGDFTISPPTYLGLSSTTAAKQNVCKADGTKLALTDFNSQTWSPSAPSTPPTRWASCITRKPLRSPRRISR
jgi:hypothetical protein